METYKKFILNSFGKSFLLIFFIFFSLIFILSILAEIEFFKNSDVNFILPIYLALINSPTLIFELFPFIFLISTQHFFYSLRENEELTTFKYFGFRNINLIKILTVITFAAGFFIIILFYTASSNLKNIYLITKSKYTDDNKYLAVINQNGLWIKDVIEERTLMINAAKIDQNFLLDEFISELDENFKIIRNIKSSKVDIFNKNWKLFDAVIYENNKKYEKNTLVIKTNYDYDIIQNLFSNLSSLSLLELFEMRNNYKKLGYSTTELDIHILKIGIYPLIFVLITIFASILSFNLNAKSNRFFIYSIGLFISVIYYYITIFLNTLASSEKLNLMISATLPFVILFIINFYLIFRINEK